MNICIACEESQRVCKAFRERGHEAYSCDIEEPSGGHPEWHIKNTVKAIMNPQYYYDWNMEHSYGIHFVTMDGKEHDLKSWDMIVAFPPCTYLTNAAVSRHTLKVCALQDINNRTLRRIESMSFFMEIAMANCKKIAIENPVGVMNTAYRKPDQIIEPYQFGEPYKKRTCLWLKDLPPLKPTKIVEPIGSWVCGNAEQWKREAVNGDVVGKEKDPKHRSKTFEGIAQAMAEQWG